MKRTKKTLLSLAVTVALVLTISAQALSCLAATVSTEFATLTTGGTVRNSPETGAIDGYIGMKITMGAKNVTVSALGRLFIAGNTQAHEVIIEDASFNRVATVTVPAGGTADKFSYADLSSPVTLNADAVYYIGSHESVGGDGWYHNDCVISLTDVATCNQSAYKMDGVAEWGAEGAAGTSYGPVSFKFIEEKADEENSSEEEEEKKPAEETKPVPTEFMTVKTFGTPRNNYGDYVGMQFTVGNKDIVVTALGRMFIENNTQSHSLMIVDAETGAAVSGSQVTVAGGKHNQFTYSDLAKDITLKAGKTYYFVSLEYADGDFWYHNDGTISYANIGKVDNAIFRYEGVWNVEGAADTVFVPVTFKYLPEAGGNSDGKTNPPTGSDLYIYLILAVISVAGAGAGTVILRARYVKNR